MLILCSIELILPKMRAGTQTLIQALQAMPWSEDQDNDDDIVNHGALPSEPESDDEDKPGLQSSSRSIFRSYS